MIKTRITISRDTSWIYTCMFKIIPVQLAERIQVKKSPALSTLCHRAKNLYNLANVRQETV
jgi:hypothetical protein